VSGTAIAEAVEAGRLPGRVWMYSTYRCNLECTYCLTESGPLVARRQLTPDKMVEIANQANSLGFTSLGVTGGEPFLSPQLPQTLGRLARVLPVVVLTNATLFANPATRRDLGRIAHLPVAVQISLDAPEAPGNDRARGDGNFDAVVAAIPLLIALGLRVRIASTIEDADPEAMARLCELHRGLGVPDEDHVVRPIVRRGRAATAGQGVFATPTDLPPELTVTADGAFWSPFGPTVRDGRLDTDLLISRTILPLERPAGLLLRLVEGRTAGADATLNIR
jgi:MoaA/NifB/PqqE/SkfB family radical SAM enzyme